ncbi:rhomboid family intramembrane serine protease [Candidatus Pacearchaeota archaeon ex4484_26]|nr:MAG: rhomboid family intramembrane serine protease [Candidatus Pacearchaeota archaeon ex4484_26]
MRSKRKQRRFRWMALKLAGVIFLIFILQLVFKGLTKNFMLVASDVLSRPWILITSIFLHGSWTHLLYNMFALFLFGSFLEKQIGSNRFLFVFFSTGLMANIVACFFYSNSLGASGAIYGIIGMLTILKPLMPILAFGVPMPMIIASILWIIVDFAGFSSYFHGLPGGIANAAHLTGIFLGALLGIGFKQFVKWKKLLKRRLKS